MKKYKYLMNFYFNNKISVFFYILLNLSSAFIISRFPIMTKEIFQKHEPKIAIYFLGLIFLNSFITIFVSFIRNYFFQYKVVKSFSLDTLKAFLNIDFMINSNKEEKELHYKMLDRPQMLINFYINPLNLIINFSKIIIIGYSLFKILNYSLVFIILVLILYFLFIDRIKVKNKNIWKEFTCSSKDLQNSINNIFRGIRSIKGFNLVKRSEDNILLKSNKQLKNQMKFFENQSYISILERWTGNMAIPFYIIMIIFLKKYLSINNGAIFGSVILLQVFINYVLSIGKIIKEMNRLEENFYNMVSDFEKININKNKTRNLQENLSIENLEYYYDFDKRLIEGLSIKFKRGENYIITGDSGSGKTTLLRLLNGLIEPISGKVNTTNKISVFNQIPYVFNMSVRDNIILGKEIEDEKILKILKKVNLMELIESFPDGLDTIIDPGANKISTGEAARLELARILLENNPVILLDEFTANIDEQNENLIFNELFKLKDRTIIAVSHRKSTIERFKNQIAL